MMLWYVVQRVMDGATLTEICPLGGWEGGGREHQDGDAEVPCVVTSGFVDHESPRLSQAAHTRVNLQSVLVISGFRL